MGFLWTFLWIVSYREPHSAMTTGNTDDEEVFLPTSPKVVF